jgi:probable rRNA maturation factor
VDSGEWLVFSRGSVLINLQKRYAVRRASLSGYVRSLKRRLRLGNQKFNICFVDDELIRRLNSAYRGKDKPTDVLSFAWNETAGRRGHERPTRTSRRAWGENSNFLGEVVISVETARHNAGAEGHSTLNELRWLILHGVLHLLGYDHERDRGEMTDIELALRKQLGASNDREQVKRQNAKGKRQNRLKKL